jgi:hypothetical protein
MKLATVVEFISRFGTLLAMLLFRHLNKISGLDGVTVEFISRLVTLLTTLLFRHYIK